MSLLAPIRRRVDHATRSGLLRSVRLFRLFMAEQTDPEKFYASLATDSVRQVAEHAELGGWIVDERGLIRRHINVFVNGERGGEDTAVAADDRVEILPAITGG